jgi:GNAT superfamily N-acetyltransferase
MDTHLPILDPLLPEPRPLPAGCGADLPGAACEHSVPRPGSMDTTWNAALSFELTALPAQPDALDVLLTRWRDHLADVPGGDGQDTGAVVTWPSRDVAAVNALLRHGLAPLVAVAVRVTGRQSSRPGQRAGIRRAGPADIDEVVRLGLETIRFDAYFGAVMMRPETAPALREKAVAALAQPEPWVWLAEHNGRPAGMAWAERPEEAGWIASMTSSEPAAYLYLMCVDAAVRGQGIGAALAGCVHDEIAACGVAATLLHYALPSPLSAPFWGSQGYRPLWTIWEVRPASALR